jgi:hypothetical protein
MSGQWEMRYFTIQLGRLYGAIDVLNAPQCTTKGSPAVTVVPQQAICGN